MTRPVIWSVHLNAGHLVVRTDYVEIQTPFPDKTMWVGRDTFTLDGRRIHRWDAHALIRGVTGR